MELIYIENYLLKDFKEPLTVSIGDFDGVHLAHQRLINEVINYSKEHNTKSAIITFDPYPTKIINPNDDTIVLTPLDEKKELMGELGVDYLIIINFTKEFSKIGKKEFIHNYIDRLNIVHIVEGYDFRFGYLGEGTPEDFKLYSSNKLSIKVIDQIRIDDMVVSSTNIRKLIKEHHIEKANKFLNRPLSFEGIVTKGNGIGRLLNIPTANLYLRDDLYLYEGVYASIVTYDNKRYKALLNYGNNPSFNLRDKPLVEIHLLDFQGDLYNQKLKVELYSFIREEMTFKSTNEFVEQINKDLKTITSVLANL